MKYAIVESATKSLESKPNYATRMSSGGIGWTEHLSLAIRYDTDSEAFAVLENVLSLMPSDTELVVKSVHR